VASRGILERERSLLANYSQEQLSELLPQGEENDSVELIKSALVRAERDALGRTDPEYKISAHTASLVAVVSQQAGELEELRGELTELRAQVAKANASSKKGS
jgi:hypothetical protein